MRTNLTIERFHEPLFAALRTMDREAINWTYSEGVKYPTGLRSYGMHVNPNLDPDPTSKPRYYNEREICDRLGEILVEQEPKLTFRTKSLFYPESKKKGDFFVRLLDGHSLFVEVKTAYTYIWTPEGNPMANGWYEGYLSSVDSRSNSASIDIDRLRMLDRSVATHAGFLLLGYDVAGSALEISTTDISMMKRNAEFQREDWIENCISWDDEHQNDFSRQHGGNLKCRVRCWFWQRNV